MCGACMGRVRGMRGACLRRRGACVGVRGACGEAISVTFVSLEPLYYPDTLVNPVTCLGDLW